MEEIAMLQIAGNYVPIESQNLFNIFVMKFNQATQIAVFKIKHFNQCYQKMYSFDTYMQRGTGRKY